MSVRRVAGLLNQPRHCGVASLSFRMAPRRNPVGESHRERSPSRYPEVPTWCRTRGPGVVRLSEGGPWRHGGGGSYPSSGWSCSALSLLRADRLASAPTRAAQADSADLAGPSNLTSCHSSHAPMGRASARTVDPGSPPMSPPRSSTGHDHRTTEPRCRRFVRPVWRLAAWADGVTADGWLRAREGEVCDVRVFRRRGRTAQGGIGGTKASSSATAVRMAPR